MPSTEYIREHMASLEEVLAFCQTVREAGGGAPLEALMPGDPGNAEACLIANNLNFSCRVQNAEFWSQDENEDMVYTVDECYGPGRGKWFMFIEDRETAEKIAAAIGSAVRLDWEERFCIELPEPIGLVAEAFDKALLPAVDASWRTAWHWNEAFPEMRGYVSEAYLRDRQIVTE